MLLRRILLYVIPIVMIGFVAGCDGDFPVSSNDQDPTALLKPGDAIPGHYIVVFNDDVSASKVPDVASDMAKAQTATVSHTYSSSVRGFSAKMSSKAAKNLANDSRVAYVEQDRVVALAPPPGKGKPDNPGNGGGGDEEDPPSSQTTPWGVSTVGSGDGTGGVAWIIDSGIDLDHPDLNVDVNRSVNYANGKDANDGNGHGTHVAGTIAAIDNSRDVIGVAAGATVVAVRVLGNNGSGSYSDVIAGVNYVAANASSGDVANMSLGGPPSTALDDAVEALAASGVYVVLAAGNDGDDAGDYSPSRVDVTNVYTISAHNQSNCLTSWSNYGSVVDYAAPGAGILSLWKSGGTNTISGTSMAAPHVAGLLVLSSLNSNGTVCSGSDPDGTLDPLARK